MTLRSGIGLLALSFTIIGILLVMHQSNEGIPTGGQALFHGEAVCPRAIPPGTNTTAALRAARQDVTWLFPGDGYSGYQVVAVQHIGSLPAAEPVRALARQLCGGAVASRSLLISLRFPNQFSPSLTDGLIFMARTRAGWKTWYRPPQS